MGQHEQKIAAVQWLRKQANECKSEPCRRFTPKQVAEGIGGAYTAIGGKVADEIVKELNLCGIPADYIREGRKLYFVLR
jgi:hypothetical protein